MRLGIANIASGLLLASIQVLLLYSCLFQDATFMNRPGLSRILLFHFLVCFPIGLMIPDLFNLGVPVRNQGVLLSYSRKVWFTLNAIILGVSIFMAYLGNTFLCVTSVFLSLYVYFSMQMAYRRNSSDFHPYLTCLFTFVVLFVFLSNLGFMDDFYAAFDQALGVTWFNFPPNQFLTQWRKTNPSPNSGISLGFGWGTNYQVSGLPVNLWNGGYVVALLSAGLTLFWSMFLQDGMDRMILTNTKDYLRLFKPSGDGLENLMRFFGAAQDEVVHNKSTGIVNNAALDEFVHGPSGHAFTHNITQHVNREHVLRELVNQKVIVPGRRINNEGERARFH